MKSHHKERMLIALGCAAGFAAVLLIERMSHQTVRDKAKAQVASDVPVASTVTRSDALRWERAPWHWSAQTVTVMKGEQALIRRVSPTLLTIPPRPGQFDLIDFRHQPSVTVELGQ